ncbi:MAG: GspE/PulE family protein [Comamonas sp.]
MAKEIAAEMAQDGAIGREGLLAWVAQARAAGVVENGGLWLGLLERAGGDSRASALARALEAWQGISVLDDEAVRGARVLERSGVAGRGRAPIRLQLGERRYGLCEDPWSAAALRTCAREPGLRLALARPGQGALAAGAVPAAPALAVAARVEAAVSSDGHSPGQEASPVVAFVDQAIAQAYADGASDIHFETSRAGLGLKYRLDGVMVAGARLDASVSGEEVISRIKVMAQLDITERRRPQDGRIHWKGADGQTLDLRVSIMPSIFGEDAVLRLLDKAQLRQDGRADEGQGMTLDALGFAAANGRALRALARRPHGMLLMTGPTGSGKTTTVYAALSEVNDGLEKIITIEDPVEYELPGVLQIPVNEHKGLTFATGLRSILRHDPDKILVGEIRDGETAEIAVQSALTGHLVFTTVHANSLTDVLGRFQHFGIEPFALASALNGVVVQRLLRRLCPHCQDWRQPGAEDATLLGGLELPAADRLPVAVGCSHCRQTGYRGRFVVAEVHVLGDDLRDLIVRRSSMSEVKTAVYRQPAQRLLWQAMEQVAQGVTTLEEVQRVVGLA